VSYKVVVTERVRRELSGWKLPDRVLVDVYLRLRERLTGDPAAALIRVSQPFEGLAFAFEMNLVCSGGQEPWMSERRAKVPFFSGCKSHLATVAPASSNRSGSGGNDAAGAFDAKGRLATPRAGRPEHA
jgi:hypothetical protein